MTQFVVNREKAINALLFLMNEANSRGVEPSQYDLVKAVFLADRKHLNEYGRPVTFDRYVAMKYGPVPSFSYDALKPQMDWRDIGRNDAPWSSRRVGNAHRYTATEKPNLQKLSKTDQACLTEALNVVRALGFGQIKRLTHGDRAYIAAWRDEEDANAFPMNMELLLDDSSDESIEDIRYLAEITSA